jgi:5-methyltetrahydrofolate--homocysteine methyltransferase
MLINKIDLLEKALSQRILILDGAMGTMIQAYNLTEADYRGRRFTNHQSDLIGNNDILSLTRPDIISAIHESYLEAGADIVSTNTFGATAISQADYHLEAQIYEMNQAAAKLASDAAKKYTALDPARPRFVAGSMGPTNRTCSISPQFDNPGYRNLDFDQLQEAYCNQAEGLLDGGVDIFLIETIFDTLNAKAAIYAIKELGRKHGLELSIWLSATVSDKSGRLLIGQTLEAFLIAIEHARPLCVGLNCSLGSAAMRPYIETIANAADTYVSIHPNAGLPDELGHYSESPDDMAGTLREYAVNGWLNIAGGCCGTTPGHIKAIAGAVKDLAPRKPVCIPHHCRLSGLEPLTIKPDSLFVNIGERTNVMGSARFARLIKSQKYEEALKVAKNQIVSGAQIIDINMDEAMLDSVNAMVNFLNYIASDPDISRVPVMIDSSNWEVIAAGLRCLPGKGIVNSISLKEGVEEFKHRAEFIRRFGAAVIVMAFDEQGQADTYERKVEICTRSYHILVDELGFLPEDIILDPNIFAVGTGIKEHNDYAVAYINACKMIKATLPHALISGGVSNLSFSFRGHDMIRSVMHSVFLYHAIKAGMDMGIVNPAQLLIYDNIPAEYLETVEDIILNRRDDAVDRLTALAQQANNSPRRATETRAEDLSWRNKPVEDRLAQALIQGIPDYLEDDLNEARQQYPTSLQIIEGPLMHGMGIVSEQFGAGKMFLPQVIKSSRVMKQAVTILQPYMDEENSGRPVKAGKILLATVKGDVHDIGKNIVGIVLRCNNYEIIDLGVMVPAAKIIETAIKENIDIIGLSGLITPSLQEMENVAREMERQGLEIPLLIGGATTSKVHTAAKIAPLYHGPSVHVENASQSVVVVNKLMSSGQGKAVIQDYQKQYTNIREKKKQTGGELEMLPIAGARQRKQPIDWANYTAHAPQKQGITVINDYPLQEIIPYINWPQYLHAWGMSKKKHDDFDTEYRIKMILTEAEIVLKEIVRVGQFKARAVIGLFPANANGDDIEIYTDNSRTEVKAIIYNLRRQQVSKSQEYNHCLADFIAPVQSSPRRVDDYIGAFAVSVGFGVDELVAVYEQVEDDYSIIMIKALADRLAEAFAERLHYLVRTEYWGYTDGEKNNPNDFLKNKYIGIRPAPGYPSCPDHSQKRTLFELLNVTDNTGIKLTESCALIPQASIAGWYIAHPQATNFRVGIIGDDQLADYAGRRGISETEASFWLKTNLVGE